MRLLPNVNILCNHSAMIKTEKLALVTWDFTRKSPAYLLISFSCSEIQICIELSCFLILLQPVALLWSFLIPTTLTLLKVIYFLEISSVWVAWLTLHFWQEPLKSDMALLRALCWEVHGGSVFYYRWCSSWSLGLRWYLMDFSFFFFFFFPYNLINIFAEMLWNCKYPDRESNPGSWLSKW